MQSQNKPVNPCLKVSAVITTRNRPEYLQQAIEGVLHQTYAVAQIVIVDDGSSCDYASLIDNIPHNNVKYIRHQKAQGANAARNTGIAAARSEIIAFLDDDDIWLPNHVEKHLKKYAVGADAVVSGFKKMGSLRRMTSDTDEVTEKALKKGNHFCGMSGFSAKKTILENNALDESLANAQDWDLYVRICLAETQFLNISVPTFLYRVSTSGGISESLKHIKIADIDTRLGATNKHRDWLGEKYYKRRVAGYVLAHIKSKKQKAKWIAKCIKLVGVYATLSYIIERFFSKYLIKNKS